MEHQNSFFGSLCYLVLPWQPVCQGVLETFWRHRSICFLITKFLKVFESNIWLNIWNNHPKILPNAKFQPNQWRDFRVTSIWNLDFCCWLKYRLWCHNYVIVVTSQTFLTSMCRTRQAWYLCKFHDHQHNNNKFMMGGHHAPPPMTDGSKKAHVK